MNERLFDQITAFDDDDSYSLSLSLMVYSAFSRLVTLSVLFATAFT